MLKVLRSYVPRIRSSEIDSFPIDQFVVMPYGPKRFAIQVVCVRLVVCLSKQRKFKNHVPKEISDFKIKVSLVTVSMDKQKEILSR